MSTNNEKIIEVFSQSREEELLKEILDFNCESKVNSKISFMENYKNKDIREDDINVILEEFLDSLSEKYSDEEITHVLDFLGEYMNTFED